MSIADAAARLACYDGLARAEAERQAETPPPVPRAEEQRATETAPTALKASVLEERWELRPDLKRGIFNVVPYRPVYGLVHWTSRANERPSSPTRAFSSMERNDLDRTELKMQFSFKTKLMQSLLGTEGDIWFGYSQVSYWQAGNSRYSSPFRGTDYEPEVMFVHPLHLNVGGLRMRFAGLGFNHQSNGQSGSLSRSWNRLIGEVAAEYGPWSFHVRPWARIFSSKGDEDDNPDIADFAGRGELVAVRRAGGHVLTLAGRHSLESGSRSHGGARFDWAFPLAGSLNVHLQIFSGYGQNLIDYNHRQTTLGLGLSFFD